LKRGANVVAFASGLLFAVGLGIAGMGRPAKVLAFLDVAGAWDPSLAFVMASAIGVHMAFAVRAKRGGVPLLASGYRLPRRDALEPSLFVGAAIFGVGWGMVGYCPGPAVVASASGAFTPIAFVGAMLVGLLLQRVLAVHLPAPLRAARGELDLAD
jgi:uncharacterized membrane protein YedE/YeeE